MNPALESLPLKQSKELLAAERRNRRAGTWGLWEDVENPWLGNRPGWLGQVTLIKKNKVFSVMIRPLDLPGVVHLGVSSLTGDRPTWWEMQRIKNEIAGDLATAVEVYPPQDEVVDGADMFHIWTVPPLPFSLHYGARTAPMMMGFDLGDEDRTAVMEVTQQGPRAFVATDRSKEVMRELGRQYNEAVEAIGGPDWVRKERGKGE